MELPRSQKELEIIISQTPRFTEPRPELEQYMTPFRIVSSVMIRAFQLGDIYEKDVYDLCAGTGVFSYAATVLKAKKVIAVEIDRKQLEKSRNTLSTNFNNVFFVQADVTRFEGKKLDTVVMNPPFGIQGNRKDTDFLKTAMKLANTIYSFHWYSKKNRDFLVQWIENNKGIVTEEIIYEFELPKQFFFHKKNRKIIKTIVFRIETTEYDKN